MENAIAIGSENHGFADGRPGIGIIAAFIEAEGPQRTQVAAGLLDLGNVHDRSFGPAEEDQTFAVGRNTGAHFAAGTAGEADGPTPFDFDGPKTGVVLVGRECAEGIKSGVHRKPTQEHRGDGLW